MTEKVVIIWKKKHAQLNTISAYISNINHWYYLVTSNQYGMAIFAFLNSTLSNVIQCKYHSSSTFFFPAAPLQIMKNPEFTVSSCHYAELNEKLLIPQPFPLYSSLTLPPFFIIYTRMMFFFALFPLLLFFSGRLLLQ